MTVTEARTERLRRVAQLTERGDSAPEIAVRLGVSARQIERDRADIRESGVPSPVVRPPTAKGRHTPCQDDPDLWFPGSDGGAANAYALPKLLCRPCPLLLPCLHHALDFPEIHGVWGGTSPTDRDRIHREKAAKTGRDRLARASAPRAPAARVASRYGTVPCPRCRQDVRVTGEATYAGHSAGPSGQNYRTRCPSSGQPVPLAAVVPADTHQVRRRATQPTEGAA